MLRRRNLGAKVFVNRAALDFSKLTCIGNQTVYLCEVPIARFEFRNHPVFYPELTYQGLDLPILFIKLCLQTIDELGQLFELLGIALILPNLVDEQLEQVDTTEALQLLFGAARRGVVFRDAFQTANVYVLQ